MKIIAKLSVFILVTAINLFAQTLADITVYSSVTNSFVPRICDFNVYNPLTVNNDYLYSSKCIDMADSIKTDTLIFLIVNIKELFIKSISFSRNGNIFCSADSFPVRDSAKWKGVGDPRSTRDTIALRDSLIYLKINDPSPSRGAKFLWLLKQKYVFRRGDTLKILLDKYPNHVDNVLPKMPMPGTMNRQQQGKIFMLLKKGSSSMAFQEQAIMPIFDLFGKKHLTTPEGSTLYIIPFLKGK